MLQVGWFSTGRGEGSRGLLTFVQERILRGELPVRIQFVFSNREQGEHEGSDRFLELVRSYGLPLVTLSSRKFRRSKGGSFAAHRLEYDREVMRRLEGFHPDLVVLAGYMLFTGAEMCRRYTMINLHPALPGGPTGTWQEVIWELIRRRAEKTGAMVHLATEDWDRGPVLTYFTMSLRGEPYDSLWKSIEGRTVEELKETYGEELPLFKLIRQEEYRREPYLLAETLRALAEGKVRIVGQRVVNDRGEPVEGYCLDQAIQEALKREG